MKFALALCPALLIAGTAVAAPREAPYRAVGTEPGWALTIENGLILIGECVDPFSVEAVRASMGALFTVPIVQAEWADFVPWLRAGPGQLVGLSLDTDQDYRAATYTAPTFLLTGNEAQGMPSDYAAECDLLVKIPMLGKADSLNAAVATAVMAYEVLARTKPSPR